MKNILLTMIACGASLMFVASAFAGLPVCGDGDAKGKVCAQGGKVKTACGDGNYLDGRVSNAGTLDDRCFTAAGSKVRPVKNVKKRKKATR